MWRITYSAGSAAANMHRAQQLLNMLEHPAGGRLHCFTWNRPTVTYGVLAKPEQLLNLEGCMSCGLAVAKRPTGGGAMFHMEDCSFTVALPRSHHLYSPEPLKAYRAINRCVARAIRSISGIKVELASESYTASNPRTARFCMVTPTQYDLLCHGKKIGGAAQRHTRHGLIHQGSIAISRVSDHILSRCSRLTAAEIDEHHKNSTALCEQVDIADQCDWIAALHRAISAELTACTASALY